MITEFDVVSDNYLPEFIKEVNEKLKAIGLHLGYRVPSSMR